MQKASINVQFLEPAQAEFTEAVNYSKSPILRAFFRKTKNLSLACLGNRVAKDGFLYGILQQTRSTAACHGCGPPFTALGCTSTI